MDIIEIKLVNCFLPYNDKQYSVQLDPKVTDSLNSCQYFSIAFRVEVRGEEGGKKRTIDVSIGFLTHTHQLGTKFATKELRTVPLTDSQTQGPWYAGQSSNH